MRYQESQYTKRVKITIGDQTWNALSYDENGLDRVYVIGEVPEGWSRNDKHKIMLEGEEWHIVSFLDTFEGMSHRIQQYHPFGNHWIMEKHLGDPYPWPTMGATIE